MTVRTSFADKPKLTGQHVLLRPVEVADAADMLCADIETIRLTGTHAYEEFFTRESLENWYATRADHDDRLDLSICRSSSGRRATGPARWCSTNST